MSHCPPFSTAHHTRSTIAVSRAFQRNSSETLSRVRGEFACPPLAGTSPPLDGAGRGIPTSLSICCNCRLRSQPDALASLTTFTGVTIAPLEFEVRVCTRNKRDGPKQPVPRCCSCNAVQLVSG